jgi:secondary thiamine-phosphate synthase enzyme
MAYQQRLTIATDGKGLTDITYDIQKVIQKYKAFQINMCNVFIQHTSASLLITENADPDVLKDMTHFFNQLVPDSMRYHHNCEGPDDMPAHIKSVLTTSALNIPVNGSKLALGTWQGVYVYEHRQNPHKRNIMITLW